MEQRNEDIYVKRKLLQEGNSYSRTAITSIHLTEIGRARSGTKRNNSNGFQSRYAHWMISMLETFPSIDPPL